MPSTETSLAEPTLPVLVETIKQGDLIPIQGFTPERRQLMTQVAASVSLADSNSIESFAAAPQRKLSEFVDGLLEGLKADELGEAGDMIAELARQVKRMNLPGMRREVRGDSLVVPALSAIPFFGKYFSAFRYFQAMREEVLAQIAAIETRADGYVGKLKRVNGKLDGLLDATEENLRALEVWLAGGQQALLRMRTEFAATRDAIERDAVANGGAYDVIRVAQMRDMAEQINAFETRLVRIGMAFSRGLLSVPNIRLAQSAARTEIQNTMDTILEDIPAIKVGIVQLASARQIAQASGASEARRALRRQIGSSAQDALETAVLGAKASQGNLEADLAALDISTQRTLALMDRSSELDVQNRQKREQAMEQMGELKQRLLDGLRRNSAQVMANGRQ